MISMQLCQKTFFRSFIFKINFCIQVFKSSSSYSTSHFFFSSRLKGSCSQMPNRKFVIWCVMMRNIDHRRWWRKMSSLGGPTLKKLVYGLKPLHLRKQPQPTESNRELNIHFTYTTNYKKLGSFHFCYTGPINFLVDLIYIMEI